MSDVTDFVHSSAEGRAVGAMEERAKCCGHLTGAGKLILGFSHDFGKEVIAEGVETAGQLNLLHDWDCQNVQEIYFARPMSAEAIGPLLNAGTITPSKIGSAAVAA